MKKMRLVFAMSVGLIGGWLAFAVVGVVHAEDILRVSLPNLPSLAEKTPDGQMKGLGYEFYVALAKEMDVTLNVSLVPLARILKEMEYGETDTTFLVENPKVAKFSHSVASLNVKLLSMVFISRMDAPVRALQDLAGKVVGHPRGGGVLAKLVDLSVVREHEVGNYTQGIQMLQANRLDVVFGTQMPIYHSIKQLGISLDQFAPPLVGSETPVWFYFSKRSPNQALRERMQLAIEKLIQNGTFAKIEEQYRLCFMEGKDCAAINY